MPALRRVIEKGQEHACQADQTHHESTSDHQTRPAQRQSPYPAAYYAPCQNRLPLAAFSLGQGAQGCTQCRHNPRTTMTIMCVIRLSCHPAISSAIVPSTMTGPPAILNQTRTAPIPGCPDCTALCLLYAAPACHLAPLISATTTWPAMTAFCSSCHRDIDGAVHDSGNANTGSLFLPPAQMPPVCSGDIGLMHLCARCCGLQKLPASTKA